MHRTAGAVIDESATASIFPRYSLTPVALTSFTTGISTSPVCSGNVMGELSRGLLKSDRSPAVAGDRPSVPPTTANANSDARSPKERYSSIDRDPGKGILNKGILNNGPENGTIDLSKFKIGKRSRLYLPILEEIIAVMPSQRKQGRDDQHQCGIDSMKSDAVR